MPTEEAHGDECDSDSFAMVEGFVVSYSQPSAKEDSIVNQPKPNFKWIFHLINFSHLTPTFTFTYSISALLRFKGVLFLALKSSDLI